MEVCDVSSPSDRITEDPITEIHEDPPTTNPGTIAGIVERVCPVGVLVETFTRSPQTTIATQT
jgi:hypothetical protein